MQIETRKKLETFDEVVATLGGIGPMAAVVRRTKSAICNWRRFPGKFPARMFFLINAELEQRGAYADRDLFDFTNIVTTTAERQQSTAA